MPTQISELVTNKTLAKRLGVTPRTLFSWAAKPELSFPPHCLISGRRYFSGPAVEAWLESHWPGAPKAPPADSLDTAAIVVDDLNRLNRNRAAQRKPPHDPRDAPIDSLRISVRSHNALLNNGINTVGDLIQLAGKDLLRATNFGKKSLAEIRASLADLGFYLNGEKPSPINRRSASELTVAE